MSGGGKEPDYLRTVAATRAGLLVRLSGDWSADEALKLLGAP